jgi:POT family proton-dependent oligopeptide transporter
MDVNGLPNDIIVNLDPVAIIIMIPICDWCIYPGLAHMGFRFTPIKRIAVGFLTGAAAMAWAAVVQHYIYKVR